jgi:hypothetical protein
MLHPLLIFFIIWVETLYDLLALYYAKAKVFVTKKTKIKNKKTIFLLFE